MKKEYISDVWQLKQKGHENFEFVDVAVNDDNLLFIDPCLIERWNSAWAIKAMKHINSYFNNLWDGEAVTVLQVKDFDKIYSDDNLLESLARCYSKQK